MFLMARRTAGVFSSEVDTGWREEDASKQKSWSMIRKSGYRFSEKIILKQRDEIMI